MRTPRPRLLAAALMTAGVLLAVAGCEQAGTRPPKGQPELTILLIEYQGPQATESAEALVNELRGQGIEEAFVVPGHEHASVCVGRFDSWKDPEADEMLRRVRRIRDVQGQYPFAGVMLVPVPEPLPQNPWPLEEADGQFTLIVASWEKPGRMMRAQRYGRRLREQGYEAYVYHGPTKSTVSVGAYGPEIFDDPSKLGQPGAPPPKIVDPRVNRLMQKDFPRLVLEGEETPPEAKLKPYVGFIPGRKTPVAQNLPEALYRVSILLVNTETGLVAGRHRASGVAQGRDQLPTLVGALVRTVVGAMDPGRPARVGLAGVHCDADAERAGLGDVTVRALDAALKAAGRGKLRLYSREGTVQMLRARDLTVDRIVRNPRLLKGFEGLDFVVMASVKRQP